MVQIAFQDNWLNGQAPLQYSTHFLYPQRKDTKSSQFVNAEWEIFQEIYSNVVSITRDEKTHVGNGI